MDPSHIQDVIVTAAVVTVSTSRTPDTDMSGHLAQELLSSAGIPVVYYTVVPDSIEDIREECRRALELATCIIFTGGTGITHDDCTLEAIGPIFEKRIDGFGELFRYLSFQEIGTRALLSRAAAGVIDARAVFAIPGSSAAVRLALEMLIIPEIQHILTHALK
jgi:molybdenum cofactor biosynthesis protein B